MPSNSAARVLFWFVAASVCRINSRSAASTVVPTGNRRPESSEDFRHRRVAEFRGQMLPADRVRGRSDGRALQHVAQLANISRPRIGLEKLQHFRADAGHLPSVLLH